MHVYYLNVLGVVSSRQTFFSNPTIVHMCAIVYRPSVPSCQLISQSIIFSVTNYSQSPLQG